MKISFPGRIALPSTLFAISASVLLLAGGAAPVAAVSGPYLVKNIKTGAADSFPGDLTALNGFLIFSANGGGKGRELWRSDGTTAGTERVLDIRPGQRGSSLNGITRVGDVAFFEANDGVHGDELWVTDGTALGTHMVKDIVPGAGSGNIQQISSRSDRIAVDVNGVAYFTTYTDSHLWRSDGTDLGTYVVPGSPNYLDNLTSFNGRVYFGADGHLWRSDGTALGTKVLKTSRGALVKAPFEMAATDSLLFYQFNDSKVWRTNGTANGTFKVLDQGPGCTYDCSPMSLTADGNLMYFEADELYRSDGTASGTFAVGPYSDSSPTTMLGAGDLFYFHAADDELWATDGTPSSGHTLNKGTADHCCWEMADASGTLYFTGPLTGTDTSKLFRYDENTNTTTEMGPTSAEEPYFLTVVGNRLFFAAHDSRGHELWAVNL